MKFELTAKTNSLFVRNSGQLNTKIEDDLVRIEKIANSHSSGGLVCMKELFEEIQSDVRILPVGMVYAYPVRHYDLPPLQFYYLGDGGEAKLTPVYTPIAHSENILFQLKLVEH